MSLVFLLVIRGIKTIASFVSVVGIPVGFITLLITLFSTLDNGFVKLLEIIMKKKNIKNTEGTNNQVFLEKIIFLSMKMYIEVINSRRKLRKNITS